MIDTALKHVVSELNDYLDVRSPGMTSDRVQLLSLFEAPDTPNSAAIDRIVVSLVNVEQDAVYQSVDVFRRTNGEIQRVKPEVTVNLYVLFIANMKNYEEALKLLSQVISFFQLRSSFDYATIESLSDREGRLTFDLFSMSFEQMNHLWGALGAKYVPSVMYKVGLVGITDAQTEAEIPPITDILIGEA